MHQFIQQKPQDLMVAEHREARRYARSQESTTKGDEWKNQDVFVFGEINSLRDLEYNEITEIIQQAISNLSLICKEYWPSEAGATLSGVISLPQKNNTVRLISFNLGDSFTYLQKGKELIRLTKDHDHSHAGEVERLKTVGHSFVDFDKELPTIWRLSSGVMMSRSLGDFQHESAGLIHEPEFSYHDITKDEAPSAKLLTSSDGITYSLQHSKDKDKAEKNYFNQCVNAGTGSAKKIACALINKQEKQGYNDDTTVVVTTGVSTTKVEFQFVADGHGTLGHELSHFIEKNFASEIRKLASKKINNSEIKEQKSDLVEDGVDQDSTLLPMATVNNPSWKQIFIQTYAISGHDWAQVEMMAAQPIPAIKGLMMLLGAEKCYDAVMCSYAAGFSRGAILPVLTAMWHLAIAIVILPITVLQNIALLPAFLLRGAGWEKTARLMECVFAPVHAVKRLNNEGADLLLIVCVGILSLAALAVMVYLTFPLIAAVVGTISVLPLLCKIPGFSSAMQPIVKLLNGAIGHITSIFSIAPSTTGLKAAQAVSAVTCVSLPMSSAMFSPLLATKACQGAVDRQFGSSPGNGSLSK